MSQASTSQFYAGNQCFDGPGFSNAFLFDLAKVNGGTHLKNANNGTLEALLRSSKFYSQNVLVDATSTTQRRKMRIKYLRRSTADEMRPDKSCVQTECKNGYSETDFCVNLDVTHSFCISRAQWSRFEEEDAEYISAINGLPDNPDGTTIAPVPRIVLKMAAAEMVGLASKMNQQLATLLVSSVGVNAVTGNNAPYLLPLTQALNQNAKNEYGLQLLMEAKTRNQISQPAFIIGDGNFYRFHVSLQSSASGNDNDFNFALWKNQYEFFYDDSASTIFGTDNFVLFEASAAQLVFQNYNGSPRWKQGTSNNISVEDFLAWTRSGITSSNGSTLYFLLPLLGYPGIFVDVIMENIDCVDGEINNPGVRVSMTLNYDLWYNPDLMFKPGDPLYGVNKILYFNAQAA